MARLLIVDDEHAVAAMLKYMFEKEGHAVATAPDGVAALQALGIEPPNPAAPAPDLAILDVMLPGLDGYAVRARMSQAAHTRHVPVVMLTAKGDMRDLNEHAPNVVAHIDKPFDPRSLRELVLGMLEGKS